VVRLLLLSCPAVAALVVAWALLGGGSEQVRYVQVLGGPTRSGAALAVLLRASRADAERSVPIAGLALSARLRAGDESLGFEGTTDASGLLEARFELAAVPSTDPWLEVEEAETTRRLAAGPLVLGVEAWRAGARRNGGWLQGPARGELEVSLAAASGVFAVPFAGRLLVRARLPNADGSSSEPMPVSGGVVILELDGAELLPPGPPPVTDAQGISGAWLRPLEHAVSVRVVVNDGTREGSWYGALPIVPGALLASLEPDGISVRSPVARERAYLTLVTERERFLGASVPLTPDPDGGASGRLLLAPGLLARARAEPTWAVVSSELDKRSPGVVGWPLLSERNDPSLTFDVADRLLLDGREAALYDVLRLRRGRRRVAALALFGVGLVAIAGFWFEVRGRRQTPGGDDVPVLAPSRWIVGLALGCIVLGLGALGYFGLLER
jgi:hypothetical protein